MPAARDVNVTSAAEHSDAELGFIYGGLEQMTARNGVSATRLSWYRSEYRTASGVPAVDFPAQPARHRRWASR